MLTNVQNGLRSTPPLPNTPEMMSIGTSVVDDQHINCDAAVEIGNEAMQKTVGKMFGDVQLHRKDRVRPLSVMNDSVKVREEIIPVNTMQQLLFNL